MLPFMITRLRNATRYALEGFATALREHPAFLLEVIVFAVLTVVAMKLHHPNLVRKLLLVGSMFFVLIVELLNTAIELVVDRISTERHPLSKKAKDIGAAAVMLSLVNSAVMWIAVVWY